MNTNISPMRQLPVQEQEHREYQVANEPPQQRGQYPRETHLSVTIIHYIYCKKMMQTLMQKRRSHAPRGTNRSYRAQITNIHLEARGTVVLLEKLH